MTNETTAAAGAPTGAGEPDVLAELEAEIARELAEERPPAGGPAYQVVGALVALALGLGGAILAYGYGLGSLREPGPGLWPFLVSLVLIAPVGGPAGRAADTSPTARPSPARACSPPSVCSPSWVSRALMPVIGFEIPVSAAVRHLAAVPRR